MSGTSAPGIIAALVAAFWLGALHSFEPGHAKGVMAAFFIGQRRRVSDAIALGAIVTVAHTLSVLVLAFVVRLLSTKLAPENLEAPAQLIGGFVVLAFGAWMLFRLRRHGELFRPHTTTHEHDCPYPHRMDERAQTNLPQLFSVGLACGLVPCPQGLALLPVALGVGNLALSVWLVLAFSVGIGAVVIGLGLLVCKAQTISDRVFGGLDKHARQIQLAGAVLILVLGAAITIQAALKLARG